MGDVALLVIGLVVLVVLACLIVGVPVLVISKRQDAKRTQGMSDEDKATYLKSRRGLNQLRRPATSTPLGTTDPPKTVQAGGAKAISGLFSLAVFIGVIWYFFGGGVEGSVARDVIDQYKIAKRSGGPMDACVHAGLVKAVFLQAKDEDKYKEWQAVERADCSAAGLPSAP